MKNFNLSSKSKNIKFAAIIYGPKGICVDIFLDFLIKSGATLINAIVEDKNIIKGTASNPNQKPITASNFASPKPMPSFFLTCL